MIERDVVLRWLASTHLLAGYGLVTEAVLVIRRNASVKGWAAGCFRHMVKCARIWCPGCSAPWRQPHSIRGPGGSPRLACGSSLGGPRGRNLPAASGIWSNAPVLLA